jgi:hypothetical protein
VLVELHDYVEITISQTIRSRFEKTHEILCVDSIDDIKKALSYDYPELQSYSLPMREQLIAERRPTIQQWFYMVSKQNS